MIRFLAPAAAAAFVLSSAAQAQDPVTLQGEVKTIDVTDRENPPPVLPVSVSVTLKDEVPEGVTAPAELHDVMGGTAQVGDQKVAVLVGKSEASAEATPDWMIIDVNADGKLTDEEQLRIETSVQESRGMKILRSAPIEVSLPAGTPFEASFAKFGDREASANLQFSQYLEATAPAGIVAVVDKDFDGKLGSAGDMWTINQKGNRPVSDYGLMAMDEHVFLDGNLYGITVDGTNIELSSRSATGPVPEEAAAQRKRVEHLWMERFDADKEAFVEARGLDTSRPVADVPVNWRYVTFDEAIELGAESKKPVFIDVMAFWCVWCYRMDWCTYNDAEVTKMLNEQFIPVKIIQEHDLAGDYDVLMKEKLKARGIPAMGVFNADGEVVHTIGGWKKPEDFIAELEKGKAAYEGK